MSDPVTYTVDDVRLIHTAVLFQANEMSMDGVLSPGNLDLAVGCPVVDGR